MIFNLHKENGFSLVETLVATVLIGVAIAAGLGAIGTTFKSNYSASEKAISQKIAAYVMTNNVTDKPFEQTTNPSYANGAIVDCSGITIADIKNNPINCTDYYAKTIASTLNDTPLTGTENIQKITVTVMKGTRVITSLQNYKDITDGSN